MKQLRIQIDTDADEINAAFGSLRKLGERSPDIVKGFMAGVDSPARLLCVEGSQWPSIDSPCDCVVTVRPSALLIKFLAENIFESDKS